MDLVEQFQPFKWLLSVDEQKELEAWVALAVKNGKSSKRRSMVGAKASGAAPEPSEKKAAGSGIVTHFG